MLARGLGHLKNAHGHSSSRQQGVFRSVHRTRGIDMMVTGGGDILRDSIGAEGASLDLFVAFQRLVGVCARSEIF